MRASSAATDDSAFGIVPAILCNQPDDVVEVKPEPGSRLFVRFADGTAGRVELGGLIGSPEAGIFAELADPELFAQVRIEYGAVAWPGGADLAPDAMYAALRSRGVWVLG